MNSNESNLVQLGNVTETGHKAMAAYALTYEQVDAAIAGFDLHTYEGWTRAANALLAGAPDWTAIKDGEYGYVVTVDGRVCSLACEVGGDDAIYDEDLLLDFDASAWNDEIGCWEGCEQASADMLTNPVFVTLRHA